MKRVKFWAGLGCLLTLVGLGTFTSAQNGAAQNAASDITLLRQQFKTELTSLRAEMLQQGIEFQEWKIKLLERELQRTKNEQGRLEDAEQTITRQVALVEQSLESGTQGEGRATGEQEGMKAELNGTHLQSIRSKRQPIDEQRAELQTQLQQEQQQ